MSRLPRYPCPRCGRLIAATSALPYATRKDGHWIHYVYLRTHNNPACWPCPAPVPPPPSTTRRSRPARTKGRSHDRARGNPHDPGRGHLPLAPKPPLRPGRRRRVSTGPPSSMRPTWGSKQHLQLPRSNGPSGIPGRGLSLHRLGIRCRCTFLITLFECFENPEAFWAAAFISHCHTSSAGLRPTGPAGASSGRLLGPLPAPAKLTLARAAQPGLCNELAISPFAYDLIP
jgi:hypothetical protein